ncbi:MAG: type II toxin-antitoxin system RelE/ParE family toxin [Betaproteobacteria bacterium]|nr:type II toxin-antitoxin system RelE/ParE family toxin [Betaproteobacteria bacterium]
MTKQIVWIGASLEDLSGFPDAVKREAGHQLWQVQNGLDPDDWDSMNTVGPGAYEIRIHDEQNNIYRVIYVAKFPEALYVLHAFQKKTRKTSQKDIDLAGKRYRHVMALRKK